MRRSQSYGRSRRVMSLENENLDGDNNTPVEEPTNNAESLETDLVEVQADTSEAAEGEAVTDEMVEGAEALESIANGLRQVAKEGGLTRSQAFLVNIAVEQAAARARVDHIVRMPALESFGGSSTKVGATTIAMESVVETLKAAWRKIIQWIKDGIKWLQERYTKIFGAANKLEKRAEALVKRAEATTGAPKEKKFDSERLVKALHVSKQVTAVAANAGKLQKAGATLLKANNGFGEAIADALEERKFAELKTAIGTARDMLTTNKVGEAEGFSKPSDGMEVHRSDELLGGQALILTMADGSQSDDVAIARAFKHTSYLIAPYAPKEKAPTKSDLPTLSTADCITIAEAVAELARDIQRYKTNLDKVSKIKERIVKAAEKVEKETASEDNKDKAAEMKVMQTLAAASPKLIDNPAASFSGYALNTGKALCDYVELSLKQYGSKDD